MKLNIFNRIFLSFLFFVFVVLAVFWFSYFREATSSTKERINNSVATDALLIESEVGQFFTIRKSEINILSEMEELKMFLQERGLFKTKVRGELEKNLVEFARNNEGIERIRVIEPQFFSAEPTLIDVQKYKSDFAKEEFKETIVIKSDPLVEGRYEADYEYSAYRDDAFIRELVDRDAVVYSSSSDGENRLLSVGKAIKNKITGEITGMLVIDYPVSYLRKFFYVPSATYIESFSVLTDNGLNLFSVKRDESVSPQASLADIRAHKVDFVAAGAPRVFSQRLGDFGPVLVVEVDTSKARSMWLRARLYLYILFMGFTSVSVVISYLLSRSIAKPIRSLNDEVHRFDENDPRKISVDTRVSEIGELTLTFNKFVDRLQSYERELRLKARLAAIGQTTSMIAHDVRRPLAGIRAVLGILKEIKDDEATLDKVIAEVDRNVSQTNRMLDDILDFSRDRRVLDVGVHDPQALIASSVREVLAAKGAMDVKFAYDLRHRNYLHVDGTRVVRAMSNIIANAVEAVGKKGRIWIESRDGGSSQDASGGPKMTIVIGNDGPVIPAEVIDRIFDPFVTHEKKGGSGLGLAVCRRVTEMHGGAVRVESMEMPDGGRKTEFTMEFPARPGDLAVDASALIHDASGNIPFVKVEKPAMAGGDSAADIASFGRLHAERGGKSFLLIVDDEPLFRLSLRTLIANMPEIRGKVSVVEADSAEKALELLKDGSFEYVITDIDMGVGRMDGYEFVRAVLKEYPDVHIMIHSNKRQSELDESIIRIESRRFMGFMPKPMREADLAGFLALRPLSGAKTTAASSGPAVAAKKVLILNDDGAIIIALKHAFKTPGVEVVGATTVAKAREVFDKGGVALVLADINLGPGEADGYELVSHIRSSGSKIPIYMISGSPLDDEKPKAIRFGADDYFQSPLSDAAIARIKQNLQ